MVVNKIESEDTDGVRSFWKKIEKNKQTSNHDFFPACKGYNKKKYTRLLAFKCIFSGHRFCYLPTLANSMDLDQLDPTKWIHADYIPEEVYC